MKYIQLQKFEKLQFSNQPLEFKEIIKGYFWSSVSLFMDRVHVFVI